MITFAQQTTIPRLSGTPDALHQHLGEWGVATEIIALRSGESVS